MATMTAVCPSTTPPQRTRRPTASAGRPAGAASVRRRAGGVATSQPVHLTRRGRLLLSLGVVGLTVGALGALLTLLMGLGATPAAATATATHPTAKTFVVQPGQSLWTIAVDVAPQADPRETITMLREINNLGTGSVYAGQRLLIPTRG